MSNTIRIALVGEGVTDFVVLKAAIESMLNGRSFVLTLLQPEGSVAFAGNGDAGTLGGGWKGVYKWCRQARIRAGGSLSGDPLFLAYDLLILHLDADVAREDPAKHPIDPETELAGVLPCEQPCPPASATTTALRSVMLSWVGETQIPAQTVLCTPSKSTEAWVMAAFFPNDKDLTRAGWECHANPAGRLTQKPLKERFAKTQADYEARAPQLCAAWPAIAEKLTEAGRFRHDFMTTVQGLHVE